MKKTRVLIVDDEEDVIAALRFRLATAGYEVVTARNGAAVPDTGARPKLDRCLALGANGKGRTSVDAIRHRFSEPDRGRHAQTG